MTPKIWLEARTVATNAFDEDATPSKRHAMDGRRPLTGHWITTLCGEDAIVTDPVPGMPAPECMDCDRVWREQEGVQPRDVRVVQVALLCQ